MTKNWYYLNNNDSFLKEVKQLNFSFLNNEIIISFSNKKEIETKQLQYKFEKLIMELERAISYLKKINNY